MSDRYDEKAETVLWHTAPWMVTQDIEIFIKPVAQALRDSAADAYEDAATWTDGHPRRWRADLTQDFKDKAAALRGKP